MTEYTKLEAFLPANILGTQEVKSQSLLSRPGPSLKMPGHDSVSVVNEFADTNVMKHTGATVKYSTAEI